MTILKSGMRLKSAVCSTELMVIRAPVVLSVDICCGGVAMLASHDVNAAAVIDPQYAQGSLVGKRYVDAADRFELLCTKGGDGSLSIAGEILQIKIAKALPSSD